jgi:hypothetical protein
MPRAKDVQIGLDSVSSELSHWIKTSTEADRIDEIFMSFFLLISLHSMTVWLSFHTTLLKPRRHPFRHRFNVTCESLQQLCWVLTFVYAELWGPAFEKSE